MSSLEQLGYDLIDKVRFCSFNVDWSSQYFQKGFIPDFVLRPIIRALCRQRLREIHHGNFEKDHEAKMRWIKDVRTRQTIAEHTEKANQQHYEVNQIIFLMDSNTELLA